MSNLTKLIQRSFVLLMAFALPDSRTVGFKAINRELPADFLVCFAGATRLINIFDTQQPEPTRRAGIGVACHRRNQRTEVQRAAGRRRKAPNVGRAGSYKLSIYSLTFTSTMMGRAIAAQSSNGPSLGFASADTGATACANVNTLPGSYFCFTSQSIACASPQYL